VLLWRSHACVQHNYSIPRPHISWKHLTYLDCHSNTFVGAISGRGVMRGYEEWGGRGVAEGSEWWCYETSMKPTILMLAESLSLLCLCLSHDWDQVTKRTTRQQQGQLMNLSDDMANLVWWPMWLLLTTPDDLSDDQNTTLTPLMTMGDYLGWSMWWPVDDPQFFLDDIWWLHLAIFIAKVKSCLSCRLPSTSYRNKS